MSSSIEKLKELNQQELPLLDKPYQLAIYAIPSEQWEAMTKLLGENLPWLPWMGEWVQNNASEQTLNERAEEILSSVTHNRGENKKTLSVMERQAGKDHGNLSLSLRELEQAMREEISSLSQKLRRIWLVSGFLSLAILLALFVILGK